MRFRRAAETIGDGVELSAYCLMPNHFHLIVWQQKDEALRRLVQSVLNAYVRIYNQKYGIAGPMFKGPFRCVPITDNKQLRYTTAYVNLNHRDGPEYRYSSHAAYVDEARRPGWLTTYRTLELFGSVENYERFAADTTTRKQLNRQFFGA
ncbi:MAG: transposase [Solirubrobacterales bacterium]